MMNKQSNPGDTKTAKTVRVNLIRDVRLSKNLTLHQLAEDMGVSVSALEKVEKGQRRLKQYFLEAAAKALNEDPHRLANGQPIDQEARVVGPVKKPKSSDNRPHVTSIPMYRAAKYYATRQKLHAYIANIPSLTMYEEAFAIEIGHVSDEINAVTPFIEPGVRLYCHPEVYPGRGHLVVWDAGDKLVPGVIASRDENTALIKDFRNNEHNAPTADVYRVEAIKFKTE